MERQRGTFRYCAPCRATRCLRCRLIGSHQAWCGLRPDRPVPVEYDTVSVEVLHGIIAATYRKAWLRAGDVVGREEALDIAHDAIADLLARRTRLAYITPSYLLQTVRSLALMRVSYGARHPADPVEDFDPVLRTLRTSERGRRVPPHRTE